MNISVVQVVSIFINVITPVFALVAIGYFAGPPLGLQARTLSRFAYFILIPAFIFNVISSAEIQADLITRMVLYTLIVHLACALLGFGIGWILKRPRQMISAYVLIAVFGNVGNFGLPLISFRLGEEAVFAATVYFLAIIVIAFVIGVAAANWNHKGSMKAALEVLKTPALLAMVPAFFFTSSSFEPPLFLTRITGLLGAAMIPTMLVTLGISMSQVERVEISRDVYIASAIRLIGGPVLAFLLVIPFGLSGIERGAGILQASMPTAVLATIIAMEYDLLPDFVTTTVLFTTIVSVVTLTTVLALV
ncbi:MAG: AEC family transporter [Anaerolineae bacterium]|nr:AEC family transporter [Anaerolineae bacterium]